MVDEHRFPHSAHRCLLLALLTAAAVAIPALAAAQTTGRGEPTFYYRFDERVRGRLATSVLAVHVPPRSDDVVLQGLQKVLPEARPMAERERFVEEFRQENVVFLQLARPLGREEYFALADVLRQQVPDRRWGHPFFVDGQELPLIVTDEIVVRFRDGISDEAIQELHAAHGVEVIRPNPHVPNQVLLRVRSGVPADALRAANRYQESGLAVFSHPNFLVHVEYFHTPADTSYPQQWHLENAGGSMTADADVDAAAAWDLTLGDPAILVAVIDGGFEITHPDLAGNHQLNTAEVAANGVDDDGNGYVDDVNGWSFVDDSDDVSVGLLPSHGQPVAGLVAAEENGSGVVGVCPRCRLLLIANTFDVDDLANAFYYARDRGADVITNSWGATDDTFEQPVLIAALADVAANGRGGLGTPILFASGNGGGGVIAYPARDPNTLAIGGSDCTDVRYGGSQYGDGLSVVSPTRQTDGTCGLVTTGLADGVNTAFGGTSGATPIAAGVVGLALSANPALTLVQVQRLLQDAADKTADAAAGYGTTVGFSQPASPPVPAQPGSSHGWGRVNAFESVRIVVDTADGGRGGRDVFLRDNRLDWGNTEQPSWTLFEATRGFIPHWQSVDIKVDTPPYQSVPTTSAQFDALTDEDPRSGEDNRVYVRVRNRGPQTVSDVTVSLHWAFAGTLLPALPADFWTLAPGVASDANWNSLGTAPVASLPYSGASAAGCPGRAQPPCGAVTDDAAVVQFTFPGPTIDPTQPNPRHYCVLAVLHTSDDPVSAASLASLVPDWITPRDNNVTHRNLVLQDGFLDGHFAADFYVRNPTAEPITTRLALELPIAWRRRDPAGTAWELRGAPLDEPFEMAPGEQRLVTLEGQVPPRVGGGGAVTVHQTVDGPLALAGGVTFVHPSLDAGAASSRPALSLHLGVSDPRGALGRSHDGGIAAALDVEVPWRPRLSWVGRLGLSTFDGQGGADDLDVWDLSARLKLYPFPAAAWRPFAHAGAGYYRLDGDSEAGFGLGVGVARRLGARTRIEAVADYHSVTSRDPDAELLTFQLGLLRGIW